MDKIKEKVNINIDYDIYKKIRKMFPKFFIKLFFIPSIVWILLSLLAMIPDETETDPLKWSELILVDLLLIFIWLILSKIIDIILRKVSYKRYIINNSNYIKYDVLLYENYLEIKNEKIKEKIMYNEIKKYKETTDTLYLVINKNVVIPILKEKTDLVYNIKNSIDNKSNDLSKNINAFENKKKDIDKSNLITVLLIVLAILCLLTPLISLFGWAILIKINKAYNFETFKYLYGGLLGGFFPILSIIFGIKYRGEGAKSIVNIIIGIIMCIFVLMMSLSSLVYSSDNFEKDYSKINIYKNIIAVELPKEAKYISIKYDESYLKNHISSYARFSNIKESNVFYQELMNSDKWIIKNKVNTTLNNFIPLDLVCKTDNCYYSIYIYELDSYNTIPNESGLYHIVTMMYDPSITTLRIEDFKYTFRS